MAALSARMSRDPFIGMTRSFDDAIGRMFNGNACAPDTFAVDVREDGDHLFVDADLPGFTKDQIDITLENQTLTIAAERNVERTNEGAANGGATGETAPAQPTYLLRERRATRLERSFGLPPTIDPSTVQAKFTDGVLTVTLTKRQEVKPRKISVA